MKKRIIKLEKRNKYKNRCRINYNIINKIKKHIKDN